MPGSRARFTVMTRTWQCHNGHSWTEQASTDATVVAALRCPVCGSKQTALLDDSTLGCGSDTPSPMSLQTLDLNGNLPEPPSISDTTARLPEPAAHSDDTLRAADEPGPAATDDPTVVTPEDLGPDEILDDTVQIGNLTAGVDLRRDCTIDRDGPVTAATFLPPAPPEASPPDENLPGTVRDKDAPAHKTGATRHARPRRKDLQQVHVPGYEVLGVLGRGGMGVVYKARHLRLDRTVALKMILAGIHADESDLARFLIEAKAIAQLQHPNIVSIYEIGEFEGKPYFSLEYLDGGSLQGQMSGVPMPPRQAAQMIETLARAVHFAHDKGIIHRDLKPANVLLTADGAPKLTDFGLAKQIDAQDAGHTGTEAILGTPSYMAPEQAAGKTRQMGPPGDIYSLGAVLYDLLTGRPPFRGTTVLDTLQQVQKAEPVAPARLVPSVPLDLQTICLKCLEKDPARRYGSARALADDLQRYLEGVPIHARPTPAWERAYKWAVRNPALAGMYASIAAAVVMVMVVGGLYTRQLASAYEDLRVANAAVEDTNRALVDLNHQLKHEKQEAVNARGVAEKKKAEAEAARKEVDQSFLLVQDSVKRLIAEAHTNLKKVPRAEAYRQNLLQEAERMVGHFLDTKRASPNVVLRSARALRYNAELLELLGKSEAAHAKYQEAGKLYSQLIAGATDADELRDYQKELFELHMLHWFVVEKLDAARAAELLAQMDEFVRRADADGPDAEALRYKAAFLNNRGIHLHQKNDFAGALKSYRAAERILADLTRKHRMRQEYWLELGRTQINLGALWAHHWTASLPEDPRAYTSARAAYEQAIMTLEAVFARVRHHDYAKELGRAYINLGVLLRENRQPYGEVFRSAVTLFERAMHDAPDVPDYRRLHALAAATWGQQLLQDEHFDKAFAQLAAARPALEKLVSDFADDADYQHDLARCCNGLGLALIFGKAPAPGKGSLPGREPLEKALRLLTGLVQHHPQQAVYRQDLDRVARNLIEYHRFEAERNPAARERAEDEIRRIQELQTGLQLRPTH